MKLLFSSDRLTGIIEPLEARIAPAQVFIGDPDPTNNKDTEYIETNPVPLQKLFFTNTSAVSTAPGQFEGDPLLAADDLISKAVDGSGVGTYYMKLKAGDSIEHFTAGSGYNELISVQAGYAIAFFVDYNHNNDYDDTEFTGLALSKNAQVLVSDKIYGDIVTNLNLHGTKSTADDTLDMTGLVSRNQGIGSLQVLGGSVFGSVFSGGDIRQIAIAGGVNGVYAGTAANGKSFDFFPHVAGGQGDITFAEPAGKTGASIKNGNIQSVTDAVVAGAGGLGAAGGKLVNIQITNDNSGLQLLAGNGGAADAASGFLKGGAGGVVRDIFVSGVPDPTPNGPLISQFVTVKAGVGGDGLVNTKGGDGGKVSGVFVGFDLQTAGPVNSAALLGDNVLIQAGAGGAGKTGGLGGSISGSKVRAQIPDGNGDEIALKAGKGGDSLAPAGGAAGLGGSVNDVDVRNQVFTFDSDILIAAGNAGATVGKGVGVAGGSVTNASLLGFDLQVVAGDGSDGSIGGAGGSIGALHILDGGRIVNHNALVNAGKGGNATKGNAGAGGVIDGFTVDNSDIQTLTINSGSQGNGGISLGAVGGKGGSVSNVNIAQISTGVGFNGPVGIRAGNGGDGAKGGGGGGNVTQTIETGVLSEGGNQLPVGGGVVVRAGSGGHATKKGFGGRGGRLDTVQIATGGAVQAFAGIGGDGKGELRDGGKGGLAVLVGLNAGGDALLVAGAGGNADFNTRTGATTIKGGAPGRGGDVVISGLFSKLGAAEARGGNAGASGNAPAVGGGILGGATGELVALRGTTTVRAIGGNGSHGGAGGSIANLAYGSTSDSLTPTPAGDILIKAGNGSSEGAFAGAGGSISFVDGAVSSGANSHTMIIGGKSVANLGVPVVEKTKGTSLVSEVQQFDIAPIAAIPKAMFSVTIGGITSGLISPVGTLADFQAALDTAFGTNVVTVSAQAQSTTGFEIAFTATGDKPPITVTAYTGRVGGKGGTISDVTLSGYFIPDSVTPDNTVELTLLAGDGGNVDKIGKVGGKGGNVRNVGIVDVGPNATIRSIAAGDGGDALKTGGKGGSISSISVQDHDIGVRSGQKFGYDAMGGLFAGVGGKVSFPGGKAGLAGSVLDVNANAIASIVAGRTLVPELATKVARVNLNDSKQLVARDGALVRSSPFTLTFGSDTTLPIGPTLFDPQTGKPFLNLAAAVEYSLDQLGSIKATGPGGVGGSVSVKDGVNGTFIVSFNNLGDQVILTGEELVPVKSQEVVRGAVIPFTTIESSSGIANVSVSELTAGQRSLDVFRAVSGDSVFNSIEETRGALGGFGASPVQEVQRISIASLAPFPTGKFTLTFGRNTTPLPGLPASATAQNIADALNKLASVSAVGGVTVVSGGNASFDIHFKAPGDQPAITGDFLVPEVQRLQLGDLPLFTSGGINLTFGTSKTPMPLPANPTFADIDAALEALPSIKALAGPLGNQVSVSLVQAGVFDIKFAANGRETLIVADGLLPEVQEVNLGTLASSLTGTFTLTFDKATTLAIPVAADGTGPLAADIDAALEGLAPIAALNGPVGDKVKVTKLGANKFDVTFNGIGDKHLLTAAGVRPETQLLDLGKVISGPSVLATTFGAEYTLSVSHFVNVIEKHQGVSDPVIVHAIQEGQIDLPVFETVRGDAATAEIQTLDLGNVLGTSANGTFILDFAGEKTTPILASSPTLLADIQAAVSALQTVTDAGGVTVTAGAVAHSFVFTFTNAGDETSFIGTGKVSEVQGVDLTNVLQTTVGGQFTLSVTDTAVDPAVVYVSAPLAVNATPAEVQTALNAVQTKINADHQARNPPVPNGLGFAVAAGANPDEYKIVFNDIGDQALITGEGGGTADHEIQTINLSGIESGGPNGFAANTFDLVFDPDGSGPLPSDVTPQLTLTGTDSTDATAIQTALNALPGIKTTQPPVPPGSGAVAVTTTAHGVFDVTFNFFGDQTSIGGLSQVGPDAQHLGVTSRLHYNATAADIQTALALVSEVPITVTNGATPGAFTLAFAGNGNQPDTTGVGYFHETQNVDVYAIGDFVATFGTKSTQRLAPPPDPILHPADAAAAAAAIDAQLELLPGIVALNGPVGDKVEVAIGPNSSFKVLFHADGDQPALSGTQFEAMTASNIINGINRNGTATNVEVQEISYIQKGAFNEAYYGAANLVGAITDINEIDSNIFHYLHNGVLQSSKDGPFQPGDTPIDGLIMAKKFNQATVNFTPEAKFTFAGFFDNDNLI